MKKLLAVAMGLWFVSAAGMAMADEAALQADKQELKGDVHQDQSDVNQADGKMGKDQGAINSRDGKINDVKKNQRDRYQELLTDRALLKDDKAKGDGKAVAADLAKIHEDHHALYLDQKKLDKTRANRDENIEKLKTDRGTQEADVKKLDSNEQKLDKTDGKIADQKQDKAAQ